MSSDVIICLSDLWTILRKKRRLLLLCAGICAGLFLGYGLFKEPTFEVGATFHEKPRNTEGNVKNVLTMLAPMGGKGSSFAIPIFNSRVLIEQTVKDCGMQVCIKPPGKSLMLLLNLRDNILAQIASLRNRASSVVDCRAKRILFKDVQFDTNYRRAFTIKFMSDTTFDFLDPIAKTSIRGQVGEPCDYNGIKFTVMPGKTQNLSGESISVVFYPMYQALQTVYGRFSAKVDKKQEGFIKLSYAGKNPVEAAQFLNVLMAKFTEYIKAGSSEIVDEQISFLDKARRKSELALEERFQEYKDCAMDCIGVQGVFSSEEAMKLLAIPLEELLEKKMYLEAELASLSADDKGYQHTKNSGFSSLMSQLDKEVQELTLRRRALDDLLKGKELDLQDSKVLIDQYQKSIKKHDRLSKEVNSLIKCLKQEEQIPHNLTILEDSHSLLSHWVSSLEDGIIRDEEKKVEFIKYLEKYLEDLQVKEKILQEGLRPNSFGELTAQGATLEAAEQLYTDAVTQLSQVKLREAQIEQALKKIDVSGFEVSSLASVFHEDVIRQMIGRAGQLVLQLQDDQNYSLKEKKRIASELRLQKEAIKLYLKNNQELVQLEREAAKGRIYQAQQISFDLINQRIALLKHQMEEATSARKSDLKKELKFVKDQSDQINLKMRGLPERWLIEKKLQMHTDLQSEMMRTLVSLVESKRVSANLDIVESKPVDRAILPIRPRDPGLILKVLLGWIFGYILSASSLVIAGIARGLVVSPENLTFRKFHLGGVWNLDSPFEAQIDVLRRAISQIMADSKESCVKNKVILWLGGSCPSIYKDMAKLFFGQGKKTLVICADFASKYREISSEKGLLQYFEKGEAPVIIQKDSIDYIASGGESLLGPEYLLTDKFHNLLKEYSGIYDQIILYSDIEPVSSSASLVLSICDRVVVSVECEKIDDIERLYGPIVTSKNITFIYFEKENQKALTLS